MRKNKRKQQTGARLKERKKIKSLPGVVWKTRRRAAIRFFRRGSLTAEAALAVPLFFFCMIALISFLGMYRVSMENTVRLQQEAERFGQAAGITGSLTDVIDLYESVPAGKSLPFFPGMTSGIACRGRVYAWIGRDEAENTASSGGASEPMVYVTEHQSVYHTDSRCTHLNLCVEAVGTARIASCRNSEGKRYHACDKCAKSGAHGNVLYITPEGDCFHCDAECSGLTRTVRLVRQSEADGLPLCSRCAAREAEGS